MNAPRLLAAGGAHIDRRGTVAGRYVAAASNPGSMREDIGGGVFNAARAAARRGIEVWLFSVHGGDAGAAAVEDAVAAAGLNDLSACYIDRATPSYTAILDSGGELMAALADMNLYEIAFPKQVKRRAFRDAAAAADALLLDTNLPEGAIGGAIDAASGPIHAIGISPAKVVRLRPHLARLTGLVVNRAEAMALLDTRTDEPDPTRLAGLIGACGVRHVVVTAGKAEIGVWSDGRPGRILPPPVEAIADVTGAGDALTGAFVAAMMRGKPFAQALREGIAAAGLTVTSGHAAADFDADSFEVALARVPLLLTEANQP